MTPDDAELMAYADGELDPLAAKRVERAIAADPALAETVEQHRALRRRLDAEFAPVLREAVPEQLSAKLQSNVTDLASRPAPASRPRRWLGALALAASLVLGIVLGTQWRSAAGPVATTADGMIAAGDLARRLDTQLASANAGDTRMIVSFRARDGRYCRVFSVAALDGLACRTADSWQLLQTRSSGPRDGGAYRQAASGDPTLMTAAQDMMRGDPLDDAAEQKAREAGWR